MDNNSIDATYSWTIFFYFMFFILFIILWRVYSYRKKNKSIEKFLCMECIMELYLFS